MGEMQKPVGQNESAQREQQIEANQPLNSDLRANLRLFHIQEGLGHYRL